jgi:chromate transporter
MSSHRLARHHFLEGVAAGVVGVIVITTVRLAVVAIPTPAAALIALGALVVLYRWRHKLTIPAIVAGAGLIGWLGFN